MDDQRAGAATGVEDDGGLKKPVGLVGGTPVGLDEE